MRLTWDVVSQIANQPAEEERGAPGVRLTWDVVGPIAGLSPQVAKPKLASEVGLDKYFPPLLGGPTQAELEKLPAWKRIWSSIVDTALGVFEPLTFAGDLAKSVVYAAKTGRWDLVVEQLRRAPTYAPFGHRPRPVVTAEELNRELFGEAYDKMNSRLRFLLNFATDVLVDPLAVFSFARLPLIGLKMATEGTAVAKAAEGAIQALSAADRLAQATLNPFNIAARTAKTMAKPALQVVSEAVEPLLQKGIERKVKVEGLGIIPVPVRVKDLFTIFTPKEAQWLGEAGVTVAEAAGKMKAGHGKVMHEAVRGIAAIEELLNEHIGKPAPVFGVFGKKVIPGELQGLAREIKRLAAKAADEYGWNEITRALSEFKPAIGVLSKTYGVPAETIASAVRDIAGVSKTFSQKIAVDMSQFPVYVELVKRVAKEHGLDPETVWSNLATLRLVGGAKSIPELIGREFEQLSVTAEGLPQKPGGRVKFGQWVREYLISKDQLEKLPQEMRFWAAPLVKGVDDVLTTTGFEKWLADMDKVEIDWKRLEEVERLLVSRAPREAPRKLDRAYQDLVSAFKGGPYQFITKAAEFVGRFGEDEIGYVLSKNPNVGRVLLGIAAKNIDPSITLMAFGKAAWELADENPAMARYLFSFGAPLPPVEVKTLGAREVETIISYSRMHPSAARAMAEPLGEHAQELVEALAAKDVGRIGSALGRILDGRGVDISQEALENLLNHVRNNVEGGDRLVQDLIGVERWKDIAARDPATLHRIEREALNRLWAMTPNWGGLNDVSEFYAVGNYVTPFSPLIVFENIRRGYFRRVWAGLKSPEAVMGALLKARLALLKEADLGKAAEWMVRRYGDRGRAFARDLENYVLSSGLVVYPVEVLGRIAKANGIDPTKVDWADFIAEVSPQAKEAMNEMRKLLTGSPVSAPGIQHAAEEAFQARVENADALVQLWDVDAALAEFGRAASQHHSINIFMSEIYKALKQAGLVIENIEDIPYAEAQNWRLVPDQSVTIRGGISIKTYGPLAGKYIPAPVFEHIMKVLSTDPVNTSFIAASLAFWRKALLNSPTTTVKNIIGNMFLTWANGGGELFLESLRQMPRAMRILREFMDTGKLPEDMKGVIYFLQGASLSAGVREALDRAIMGLTKELSSSRGWAHRVLGKLDLLLNHYGEAIAKAIGKEKSLALKLLTPLDLFAYAENVQRLANYLAARKLGNDPEAALRIASQTTFDYSMVPYAIRLIRDYGLIAFPAFMYFTAKATARWAVEQPVAILGPAKLAQASYTQLDPETRTLLATTQPEWLRKTLPLVLPIRTRENEVYVVPLLSLTPIGLDWGDITEAFNDSLARHFLNLISGREPIGVLLKELTPKWMSRVVGIPDAMGLALNGFDIQTMVGKAESLTGKLAVRYLSPDAVALYEQTRGVPVGLKWDEAVLTLLTGGRRVGTDITGVTTYQLIKEYEEQERLTSIKMGREPWRAEKLLQELYESVPWRKFMAYGEGVMKAREVEDGR